LRANVPFLGAMQKLRLGLATPFVLRETARVMLRPPEPIIRQYGIPPAVVEEAYTRSAAHKRKIVDGLATIRDLCRELEIVTPSTQPLWKVLGIWA
jgi:hypothetical protein